MKLLKAGDCLWPQVRRVLEEERPPHAAEGTVFAVFADPGRRTKFCGLASERDIAAHPNWIFADLVEHRSLYEVKPSTTLAACLGWLRKSGLEALPVIDAAGSFVGAVTQASLLRGLLKQERSLLEEARHYAAIAETERRQLERWSARLTELQTASRALLTVLAHTTLEKNLLQVAVEALTKLLEARYGAIGILDKAGALVEFVVAGISDEEAERIGEAPCGKGLLGVVIKEDTAIRLEDLTTHPQSAGFPPNHPPMKSLLAVPVSHAGRVYGRVYLCDKVSGEPFTAEDELLAMSFAHSLSLVLDNAHEMEEILKARASLDHLAHYDSLTGLPNRVLAIDRLKLALTQAHRQGCRVAVMFLDLDNFKQTNDAFGHSAGDGLLKIVAQRLLACVREGDTVARLSGDEFLLMLPDIEDIQDAATVAQKILTALALPCPVDAHQIFIGASIGVSLFPDDAADTEDLLRFADTAMFHAKQGGRNTWQFFAPAMNERVRHHSRVEAALRRALEHNELELHYQPQVEIKSGCIVGVEALLRWNSAALGRVSPAEFIPVAEEAGMIVPIGEWVLATACAQGRRWLDMGFSGLRVAVNVSARQFRHKDFIRRVRSILETSGLPPAMLELELTESLLMDAEGDVIAALSELRLLDVRVSIDDFGTGYSSLSRLKKFPISMLKIDQSFVRDVTLDADDAAIARAIITLGHSLRLKVIAEGVETEAQLEFMRLHGCNEMQGYLFSKPLPVEEFTALLHKERFVQVGGVQAG
ncbi:MAG: EAL domain-containing protein [Rhodocyclales bacterium]|nr:EAL domain-containing protein [Rhodocyclales bacterium]